LNLRGCEQGFFARRYFCHGLLAEGETDARRLAELAGGRLHVSKADLMDALSAAPHAVHRQVLSLYLTRLRLRPTRCISFRHGHCA
jgi:hypothetical protein